MVAERLVQVPINVCHVVLTFNSTLCMEVFRLRFYDETLSVNIYVPQLQAEELPSSMLLTYQYYHDGITVSTVDGNAQPE